MCGIAGVVVAPGVGAPSPDLGMRMNGEILHRGPDDGGLHHDARSVLGMRRLSIIDVEGGHQPMYSPDAMVCIVFNGEIYNYRELRAELERQGHAFASFSDTEVILHAYLRHGTDAFAMLDGMFAVAIWDRRSGTLLLARDRFGEKPLYYHHDARRLLFGSELKCLLQADDWPRELDQDALQAYFTYGYVPAPLSVFRGVSKLPPAHWLRYRDGEIAMQRYWRPSVASKRRFASEDAAAEELSDLLERAVASRLVADVPFGAFLSGGLDSSTVVALMSRQLAAPVKTFTIGFDDARYSELDDARAVARHLGTDHHELVVQPDAVDLLERLVWHFDEPFADASAVPTFLVSELAGKHVKMVLTGDGGDELFAGYDRYLKLLSLERLGPLRTPAAGALGLAGALAPEPLGMRLRRIGERLRLPLRERYLSGVALMRPDTLQALGAGAGGFGHYHLPMLAADSGTSAPGSALDQAVEIDLHSYLPDDILVKLDRMAMANSLEGRSPFLQPDLAEFALSLPKRLRIRDGRGKHLLRKVAARWLPPAVLSKPKQGFALPLPAWFRGPLRELAADTFDSAAFQDRGMTKPSAAKALLAAHVAGKADNSEALWQLLCLERWAQRFLDTTAKGH